jgi:hypothetical protein
MVPMLPPQFRIPRAVLARAAIVLLSFFAHVPRVASQEPVVRPLMVRVKQWPRDTSSVRAGVGGVAVFVRLVEAPGRPVLGARAFIQRSKDERPPPTSSFATPDSAGSFRLNAIPQGNAYLRIRAHAHKPILIPIVVVAGCEAQVEVYLALDPFCLEGSCPETPPRATETVCRPDV